MNRFKQLLCIFLALTFVVGCNHGDNLPPSRVVGYPQPPIVQVTQPNWFVNPAVNGCGGSGCSDAFDCATANTACRTAKEVQRRFQCGDIMQNTNVFVLSTLPVNDPINVCANLYGGNLTYVGGPNTTIGSGSTALQTGTLTSCVATTPSTNTQNNCVDTAISSWTPMLNKRIRITSGARSGQWAWVGKDLGGGPGAAAARFSGFGTALSISPVSAQTGDTYQIDGQIGAAIGFITPTCGSASALKAMIFQDLAFLNSGAGFDSVLGSSPCALTVVASNTNAFGTSGAIGPYFLNNTFENSQANSVTLRGPELQYVSGLLGNTTLGAAVVQAGIFAIRGGVLIENSVGVQISGTGLVTVIDNTDQIGIFDTVTNGNSNPNGSAILLGGGAQNIALPGGFSVTAVNASLYGSGNAGYGLEVQRGATASVTGSGITITGTLGDFRLASTAGSQAYAFNNLTNAYVGPITQTWANFNASIASGGFNFNAHNLQDNSHLVLFRDVWPLALAGLLRRRKRAANDNARAKDFDSKAA